MSWPYVELKARSPEIEELVRQCRNGTLPFDELCTKVAAMGFKTTSLYEMVRQERPTEEDWLANSGGKS